MPQTLHYRYPRPRQEPEHSYSSREAQISKDLEIKEHFTRPEVHISLEPYIKHFNSNPFSSQKNMGISIDDPIEDLYQQSQKQLQQYKIELPYSEVQNGMDIQPTAQSMKRPRSIIDSGLKEITHDTDARPIVARRIVSRSRESPLTPKKAKADASFISQADRGESKNKADETFDKSSNDPLACHADNILRMAMDTTMLGSFCNSSISSNFSNLLEETIPGKKDGHDSMVEGRKPLNVLSLSKATKIEISAEDLENAIKDPLKLT